MSYIRFTMFVLAILLLNVIHRWTCKKWADFGMGIGRSYETNRWFRNGMRDLPRNIWDMGAARQIAQTFDPYGLLQFAECILFVAIYATLISEQGEMGFSRSASGIAALAAIATSLGYAIHCYKNAYAL